jgi:hypothetical protein
VPVDAEETLVEMHRELLTGGASVALTLLEERAKREPRLPAWALRRLELLRWMLLDNAATAESHAELPGESRSLLSEAIRSAVNRRDMKGALDAARAFAAQHPDDRDAERTVQALESILAEMQRQEESLAETHTIPMFGHPAAMMQVRMGNLSQACAVYRKLVTKHPDDDRARLMLADVEALLRALAGEPVADDELGGEATQLVDTERDERVFGSDEDEATLDGGGPPSGMDIPATNVTLLPEHRSAPEESGPVPVTAVGPPEGMDHQNTTETPLADHEAARLLSEGRLAEAEEAYRSLARTQPDQEEWRRRADEVRARRLATEAREGVLVRVILPVK